MQTLLRRITIFTFLTSLITLYLTFNPFPTHHAGAASYKPWIGTTIELANVQTGTTANAPVVTRYVPYTKVTIYGTVPGQAIWHDISNWYRVSNFNSVPLYIYSKLIAANRDSRSVHSRFRSVQRKVIMAGRKLIVVSTSRDQLYAYQGSKQVFSTKVITGRSVLPTPIGTFHVFAKLKNITFYSPWPKSSPYWYVPTHINYALEFLHGGYFLHDSWWHTVYGPGTNGWHHDPVYGWQWGTHGCVAMPDSAAFWLYKWAPVGIKVQINK
jgi:L,D-transpeptidase catalytic domain